MQLKEDMLFKWLGASGQSYHGGFGQWNLPQNGKPGKWMPRIVGVLKPCINGYHYCRKVNLVFWPAPRLFVIEPYFDFIELSDKGVVRQARLLFEVTTWNKKSARLFAADCAERALRKFERLYPDDDRPRLAIEAARKLARGEITREAASAAASAANSAAYSAAASAANSAAASAAYSAANSAAYSAANSAAYSAAASAANSAADSAAYSAAYSAANSAAYSAAYSAADSAADSAAYRAESEWQTECLWEYLTGKAGNEKYNTPLP